MAAVAGGAGAEICETCAQEKARPRAEPRPRMRACQTECPSVPYIPPPAHCIPAALHILISCQIVAKMQNALFARRQWQPFFALLSLFLFIYQRFVIVVVIAAVVVPCLALLTQFCAFVLRAHLLLLLRAIRKTQPEPEQEPEPDADPGSSLYSLLLPLFHSFTLSLPLPFSCARETIKCCYKFITEGVKFDTVLHANCSTS